MLPEAGFEIEKLVERDDQLFDKCRTKIYCDGSHKMVEW